MIPESLLKKPPPAPPTTSTTMVKSILFFTIVIVVVLYLGLNYSFSLELRILHRESVHRMQEKMKAQQHHHQYGKQQQDSSVPPLSSSNRHHEEIVITTKKPSFANHENHDGPFLTDYSNTVLTRKEMMPYPQQREENSSSSSSSSHHNERLLTIQDTSVHLRSSSNWRKLREHFVRSAQNFYPEHLVAKWRKELIKSWKNKTLQESKWVLATNNDGHNFGRKVMNRKSIAARKKLAQDQYKNNYNAFGYTKWEMSRKKQVNPLHFEVKNFMKSKETKEAICKMLASDCPKDFVKKATLGDFFISLFEHDDFLSSHSDLTLGSVTIAGHFLVDQNLFDDEGNYLMMKKKEEDLNNNNNNNNNNDDDDIGGAVEFLCEDYKSWCVKMKPSQNELVVFKTQPDNAPHRVTQMKDPKYLRFGVTGFYAMPGEAQMLEY